MRIYDYDRRVSPYTRYGDYGDYKMISRILSYIIKRNDFTALILRKSIYQNRPFKILYYTVYTPCDSGYIQQDIVTNNKYFLERKEYINDFNEIYDDKCILSKLNIQIFYRIMNHFLHKNKINSI